MIGIGGLGHIGDSIALISKSMLWPVAGRESANISQIQENIQLAIIDNKEIQEEYSKFYNSLDVEDSDELNSTYALDLMALTDLKAVRGYNSFMDRETAEVNEGVEPDYEACESLINSITNSMGVVYVDYKMTEALWSKAETKAVKKIALVTAKIDATQSLRGSINKDLE